MGKTGGSGQSGLRVMGQSGYGSIGLRVGSGLPVFFKQVFLKKNYKNKSMTTCLKRMNKIN